MCRAMQLHLQLHAVGDVAAGDYGNVLVNVNVNVNNLLAISM